MNLLTYTTEHEIMRAIIDNYKPEYTFIVHFIAPLMPKFNLKTMMRVRLTCKAFTKIITIDIMRPLTRSFGCREYDNTMKCNSHIGLQYMRESMGRYATDRLISRMDAIARDIWEWIRYEGPYTSSPNVLYASARKIMANASLFRTRPMLVFNDSVIGQLLSIWPAPVSLQSHHCSPSSIFTFHAGIPYLSNSSPILMAHATNIYDPCHDDAIEQRVHRWQRYSIKEAHYSDTQDVTGYYEYLMPDQPRYSAVFSPRDNVYNTHPQ